MELTLLFPPQNLTALLHKSIPFSPTRRKRPINRRKSLSASPCCCLNRPSSIEAVEPSVCCNYERREFLGCVVIAAAGMCISDAGNAVSKRALRGSKVPESEFTTLPNGLKYYDLKVGGGAEAVKGSRVAVHYVAKWRGLTFMTSRQGLGVGGGTPYGFDVGQSERGTVLKGLDLGVIGMRVGGQMMLGHENHQPLLSSFGARSEKMA